MKLENGRPENTERRLEKEIRVYDFLDKLGVEYQRVDHEAAMTMEACEEIDRTLGDEDVYKRQVGWKWRTGAVGFFKDSDQSGAV